MSTSRESADTVSSRVSAPRHLGYQMARFLRSMVVPCLVLVAVVVLWYVAVVAFDIKPYLLPSPMAVLRELSDSADVLWSSLLITAKEVIFGFVVSVIIAVPLGIALGELPALQRSLVPLLVIAQIIPKVALAPLMIVWFGLGIESKIIFIVLLSFFPIIVNTMTGIASASIDFRKLAQAVGLSGVATLRKVTLPQALPSIFAGLKVAITLAVIGAVVAEFVASQSGLGFLILAAQGQVQTALLFASIFVLTALGLLLYGIIALLEWAAMPWNRRGQDSS